MDEPNIKYIKQIVCHSSQTIPQNFTLWYRVLASVANIISMNTWHNFHTVANYAAENCDGVRPYVLCATNHWAASFMGNLVTWLHLVICWALLCLIGTDQSCPLLTDRNHPSYGRGRMAGYVLPGAIWTTSQKASWEVRKHTFSGTLYKHLIWNELPEHYTNTEVKDEIQLQIQQCRLL